MTLSMRRKRTEREPKKRGETVGWLPHSSPSPSHYGYTSTYVTLSWKLMLWTSVALVCSSLRTNVLVSAFMNTHVPPRSFQATCNQALSLIGSPTRMSPTETIRIRRSHPLYSSFFGKGFEEFEDDDEEDDDDDEEEEDEEEYDDLSNVSVADFRNKMDSLFSGGGDEDSTDRSSSSSSKSSSSKSSSDASSVDELIQFARLQQQKEAQGGDVSETPPEPVDWAFPVSDITPGTVLVAHPAAFCSDFGAAPKTPNPRLLHKFGLTLPPPADLGADRRADLLPVLIVVDEETTTQVVGSNMIQAVLLNRRTGYLLGDLEPPSSDGSSSSSPSADGNPGSSQMVPLLEKFCIQPLWFGGVYNGGGLFSSSNGGGLDMLHQCPAVEGAKSLTDDGLFWGGDPTQAQEAMSDPSLDRIFTGFDFKFFVQATVWNRDELESELHRPTKEAASFFSKPPQNIWFPCRVSKNVLFKSRDRMGTQRAKPLWTEIMELLGGDYQQICQELYKDN